MADKPILFSAPMVRALLDGRKTQTRRVLKPAKRSFDNNVHLPDGANKGEVQLPPIAIGDRLYVRESFSYVGGGDPGHLLWRADDYEAQCDRYGFDKPYPPISAVKWKPGIHMPRAVSRITLTVTEVLVERLQDISHEDARREGPPLDRDDGRLHPTYRLAFSNLWDSINGPGAWDANPWVVAYSFTVERRNIDRLPK